MLAFMMLELDVRTVWTSCRMPLPQLAHGARAGCSLLLTPGYAGLIATRMAELATEHRLPAMYGARHYVEAGGLMG
jgi:hypothetical protein